MNWKLKALVFRAFAHIPARGALYRLVQRHVTKGHFLTVDPPVLRLHQFHVENYRRVHPGRVLEFGAGRDFLSPLLLSNAGATEVLVYDIQRLSSAAQINNTIRQLRSLVPGEWPEIADCDADLARKYRIRYRAPGDARATGLPEGSVQFVCSTSVLEHIPPVDVESILRECVRIAAPGAIFSHIIDYTDHYRYADASVPMFHFYRFPARRWWLWNPGDHFQNRLRHSDFERLFERLGLEAIDIKACEAPAAVIASTPLAPEFEHYSRSDLLTEASYCVLTRS
jgi:hypothetical protein